MVEGLQTLISPCQYCCIVVSLEWADGPLFCATITSCWISRWPAVISRIYAATVTGHFTIIQLIAPPTTTPTSGVTLIKTALVSVRAPLKLLTPTFMLKVSMSVGDFYFFFGKTNLLVASAGSSQTLSSTPPWCTAAAEFFGCCGRSFHLALFHWFHDDCRHNVLKPQPCWWSFCFSLFRKRGWHEMGFVGREPWAGHGKVRPVDQTIEESCHLGHTGDPAEMQFRLTFHLVNNVSLAICSCLQLQKSAWQLHLLRRICPSQGWGCGCAFALPIKRFLWSAPMWLFSFDHKPGIDSERLYLPPLPWPGSAAPVMP